MYLAKVIGTVVSTNRNTDLSGMKLMVIRRLTAQLEDTGDTEVAVDVVGAGTGETVIVCKGSSARSAFGQRNPPVDTAIIEIVDIVEVQ